VLRKNSNEHTEQRSKGDDFIAGSRRRAVDFAPSKPRQTGA
jgi:hypothetical protein